MTDYQRIELDGAHGFYERADGALKAVPFDAIVIERSELPAVEREGDRYVSGRFSWPVSLAHKAHTALRDDALDNLALAEYLTANPPVDEFEVTAVRDLLGEDGLIGMSYDEIARRLVTRGVRVVTP